MRTTRTLTLPAALIALLLPAAANAAIVPLRFPMPSDLGAWDAFYTADYAGTPPVAGHIVASRMVLNYDAAAGTRPFHDAAELFFQIQLGTETVPHWTVFGGADLGWSGQGAFNTIHTTTAFNGEPLISTGPYVLWYARIQSANNDRRDLGGLLTSSYWEFDIETVPTPAAAPLLATLLIAMRRRRPPG